MEKSLFELFKGMAFWQIVTLVIVFYGLKYICGLFKDKNFLKWTKSKKDKMFEDIIKSIAELDATTKGLMNLVLKFEDIFLDRCKECKYKVAFPILQKGIVKEVCDEFVLKSKDETVKILYEHNYNLTLESEKDIMQAIIVQYSESGKALLDYGIGVEYVKKYKEAAKSFQTALINKIRVILEENGNTDNRNKKRRIIDFILSQNDALKNDILN